MKHWWKDPIIWLMQASLALLLYLSAVWLVNSYNREYFQIIREGEYLFTNAVRSLEDSLIEYNFDNHLVFRPDSLRRLHREFRQHPDSSTAFIVQIGRDSISESGNGTKRWQRRFRERNQEGFVGSLALQIMLGRDSTLPFDAGQLALIDEVETLIEARIRRDFSLNNFRYPYTLLRSDEPELGINSTKPFNDMFTGESYFLNINPDKKSVLMKIGAQIIFALLTFFLTLSAFIFSYQTIQKQRRLTLLKNDLISNISHELKTPISTVKVALEALDRFKASEDSEKRKEYLEISKNEVDRLALLVENVLKTSASNHDQILQLEKISLNELIEEILRTMNVQFERAGANIEFVSKINQSFIMADRLHMTSVLYNLLDNALKYSVGKPEIKLELSQTSNQIILSVVDHGKGIPKIYLAKIFEKFFRVPTGDVHNIKGHGLGLSYVADIVRRHQGTIKVQSTLGKGSEFTINFPVANG